MTETETAEIQVRIDLIQIRIEKLEEYLSTQDITFNRMLVLAGEWEGLNKVLGNTETAWSLMWRLRGM